MQTTIRLIGFIGFLSVFAGTAAAQRDPKFRLEVEAGPVWQTRNDVQIPSDTGTRFSLIDIQGKGPFAYPRVYLDWQIRGRHGLRLLYAPLSIKGTGSLSVPVRFEDSEFLPGAPVEAGYQFNSYRLTYRYRFHKGPKWQWSIGATAKVRDARIDLRQGGVYAVNDNVGVVPLAHLDAECRLAERWHFVFDLDGLAAPQGRAFDAAVKLRYDLTENWSLAAGYRTLEGGADTDTVYTFAWLHYAAFSIAYRF
jgi:hypothetical protein